ncbi:DUF4136 domain-containing protein [Geobacter sp. DSM 9736]|uniref:DUF4136 domain-containing protein n=1 Tax=Geobacter sp. DSM 9736 TaxID=1277350 RepID=UPI000B4FDBD0|nr:DUF4136 domain-containing protein [Geobacter sp. DSM 9736]SNB46786.1 hypothetical protein SAMN06269301_2256 [Geobacter sp. DSM 9736]
MKRFAAKMAWVVLASLLLTSCATISLVDSWRTPTPYGKRYGRVLVTSLVPEAETRRVYDEIVAAELQRRGVEAVPAHNFFPGKARPNRQSLQKAVKQSQADALLMIQMVRVEQQTDVMPGYMSIFPDPWYDRFTPRWGYGPYHGYNYGSYYSPNYGSYGFSTYYEPPSIVHYEVATMQANLFDAASGYLVWAGTMETMEPGRVVKIAKDMGKIISESLTREGLM